MATAWRSLTTCCNPNDPTSSPKFIAACPERVNTIDASARGLTTMRSGVGLSVNWKQALLTPTRRRISDWRWAA